MRSLLAPLVVGLVLSLAATFGVQWSVVRFAIDEVVRDFMADEMTQDADELFSALSLGPGDEAQSGLLHFDPVYLTPSSGHYFQILVDGKVALKSASLADATLSFATEEPGGHRVRQIAGPDGQTLLLTTNGYESNGRKVTVGVATDVKPVEAAFARLGERFAQVSALMFLALVVLQIGIVRFVLRPLQKVRTDMSRLALGETGHLDETVPAEILPLVREVNRLIALLAGRLQRSRESLGNLAHALKAPLTVLTQIAHDEQSRLAPETGRQLATQIDILRHRIDSELRRARIAGGAAPAAWIDLAPELDALVAALRRLHRERAIDIACHIPGGLRLQADREDFLELCGNLLDNACKWARTRVLVSAREGDGLTICIEDDGPGCTPEQIDRIDQRGVRLDEATEGHGLGLSIVRGIADSMDARVRFGRSNELGGFLATIEFNSP